MKVARREFRLLEFKTENNSEDQDGYGHINYQTIYTVASEEDKDREANGPYSFAIFASKSEYKISTDKKNDYIVSSPDAYGKVEVSTYEGNDTIYGSKNSDYINLGIGGSVKDGKNNFDTNFVFSRNNNSGTKDTILASSCEF